MTYDGKQEFEKRPRDCGKSTVYSSLFWEIVLSNFSLELYYKELKRSVFSLTKF